MVDTHMDFMSSDAGSSPTYGGPQLSRKKQKPHGKTKNLTAKPRLFCFCCEVFGFAVRYFVFAVTFLVLP